MKCRCKVHLPMIIYFFIFCLLVCEWPIIDSSQFRFLLADGQTFLENWWIIEYLFLAGDSDDELLDEEPDLDTAMFNHTGGVNRIRVGILTIYEQINYESDSVTKKKQARSQMNMLDSLKTLHVLKNSIKMWLILFNWNINWTLIKVQNYV